VTSALTPRTGVSAAAPQPDPEPRGAGTGRGRRVLVAVLPWATTVALLTVAEVLSRTGVLPEEVPPVTEVLAAGWQLVPTAKFAASLGATLAQVGIGLFIGVVVGVAAGLALGAVPVLYRLTHYVLDFLRFIPAVVYLPVLVLLMGAAPRTAFLLAALGTVWPMLFQAYYGVAGISTVLADTARVFGLRPHQRLAHVVLPAVSPFVATGLRISASHALVVVVAVQLITSVPGLGRDIAVYAANAVYPKMYALVAVVGLVGVVVNAVLGAVERRRLHWHSAYRETWA
jgi:ABC-type nitrate/sulfonate/bicarbonate transport system permease component